MKYELDVVAKQVLEKRYYQPGESTWEDVVERVLKHVVPGKEDRFRDFIRERYFIPNSPTLVNSGTNNGGLSACFVVPMGDSIEQIIRTKYDFMKICQKGGGCGTTLSNIRPEGSNVAGSTHGYAAGPVKFFSTICGDMEAMTQGAGFRDMAMMGTMSVQHPDIEKFIKAKEVEGLMNTTNLSVMANDVFMGVATGLPGQPWITTFVLPDGSFIEREFEADYLLDLIAEHAWRNGEPGLLFENTINDLSPYKYSGQFIDASNPCGEMPLPFYGTCNLGSLDLAKYYSEDPSEKWEIHWRLLIDHVEMAVEFLDAVIDAAKWPLPEIEDWVKKNRPIGVGVMGFADLLLKMGLRYGSAESLEFIDYIGQVIYETAMFRSEELCHERGIPENCKVLPRPRRNVTLLSIAPTGSIALIAGTSHGIEPVFAPTTLRSDNTGEYEIEHSLASRSYFTSAINESPEKVVSWKEHVDVQAAWQKWVDSGVSKTINMPNDATVEDVKAAMVYAWESGCKGITVYRDGSRQKQVLNQKKSTRTEIPVTEKRPRIVGSTTVKIENGGEDKNVYVTVGEIDGQPIEVFINTTSVLLPDVQMRDGFSRLSSLALKYGVPVVRLVKELRQIPASGLKSVPTYIANILEELYLDINCPECGSSDYVNQGGCLWCASCGYEKCL